MKQVIVEVTEKEYEHLKACASQLHLRGPADWLLLAGMNMRPTLSGVHEAPLIVASRPSPNVDAKRDSMPAEEFAAIARATKAALDEHEAELKGAARQVAKDYLAGTIEGKERLGRSEHADKWRKLLRPETIIAAYRRLIQRTYGPGDPSDATERWPHRISYGTFREWVEQTTGIALELKKTDLSMYFFLDALRDTYVLALRDHLLDEDCRAPHYLVVRSDIGQPGSGAERSSPY